MFVTRRFRFAPVFLFVLITCHSADGHNLYVLVKHQSKGPDLIDIIFEHAPRPGKGGYYKPLLKRGKTWIAKPNQPKAIHLKLKEMTKPGKKFLRTETKTKRPRLIVHSCTWGIYRGRLDFFHGRYLDVSSAEEAKQLSRASKLPLDIIPIVRTSNLTLKVVFKEKPLANRTTYIWSPRGKQMKRKTGSDGTIRFNDLQPGTWSFAITHILPKLTGKFEGKSYKGVMHGTSFSIRWPLENLPNH